MSNAAPPLYPPAPSPRKGFPTWAIVLIVIAGVGAIGVMIMGALAFYGVKKYLGAAKTAEAKNTIGSIARASIAAYEADTVAPDGTIVHALCESTGPSAPGHAPVPRDFNLVKARKYQPSLAAGVDFQTGTARGGWMCLKFATTGPDFYQYHYNMGRGYLARSVAPGPNGFEAAATGDVDGNGTKSLFAEAGHVNAAGDIQVTPQIYVENELE